MRYTTMKPIYNASNSLEANLIVDQLKQAGIPARIDGEHLQTIELIGSGGFVKVLVEDQHFEETNKDHC